MTEVMVIRNLLFRQLLIDVGVTRFAAAATLGRTHQALLQSPAKHLQGFTAFEKRVLLRRFYGKHANHHCTSDCCAALTTRVVPKPSTSMRPSFVMRSRPKRESTSSFTEAARFVGSKWRVSPMSTTTPRCDNARTTRACTMFLEYLHTAHPFEGSPQGLPPAAIIA